MEERMVSSLEDNHRGWAVDKNRTGQLHIHRVVDKAFEVVETSRDSQNQRQNIVVCRGFSDQLKRE